MKKQPTEGLWNWHWRHEDGRATGSVFAMPREGHAYAVAMCPQYQTREQWEIDAPVLAASKDMLAALKNIVDCYGVGSTPEKFCDHVRDFIEEARAIVAKAEGRAP